MTNNGTTLRELQIKNRLAKAFQAKSDDKFYNRALEIIFEAFASQFGTFGYFMADGSLVIPAVTREIYWEQCQVQDKKIILAKADFCGILRKAIAEKKAFYVNTGPFRIPAGHIPIENTMIAPIIFRDNIISAIHLANKAGGYDDQDLILLEAISDHLAPVIAARIDKIRAEQKCRQAEEALRDSEELHRIIIESIAHPIFITDELGNFTSICGNVPNMLDYSMEEIRGMSNLQQLTGNDLFTMLAQTSAREIRNIHCTIADKSGSSHHFLTNVKRVTTRKGSLLFTFHEVTELKHTSDALRQSEYQCRHIFDNMSSGMAVYEAIDGGRDFVFKDINRAAMKNSKVTREEIIGKSVRQVFPRVDDIGILPVFRRVRKTGLPEHHPVSHYQDMRISQWVENYVFRLPSGEIVAVYDDITEQKKAQDEVKRNESKFRRLLESTRTVPWELDLASGKFTFMGKQIETILGYPADSWLDISTWVDRLHEDDRKNAAVFCENEISKGKDLDFTYRAVHADGTIKWIQDIVSVVQGSNGPEKLVGFMLDITAKKNAEEEKVQLENRLRHAQKMESIGTLAGGIAHDFNNILGAILGYAELMNSDVPAESQQAADLKQILIAGNKAKRLVKQILAFSHQAKIERIPVPLKPLVSETMKLLRSTIPTTIEIRQEMTADCGSVLADPAQVHQILMNLCTNAYHAMEKTGGILRVELKKRELYSMNFPEYPLLQSGFFAELVVTDTGPGIDPSIRDKIFEPYFTTKEQGKGTGLGLAIIHGITTEYGGAISVDCVPGQGATFHVFLPLAEEQPMPSKKETAPLPTGSERILVIDDEESLVLLGEKMLEKLGYTVTTRLGSIEALQTFQDNPHQFDLVITDQTMPHMTGADLAAKMLQIRPDIPIILCTGYTNLISVADAKAFGIKEFVMKPVIPADMARIIRQVLDAKTVDPAIRESEKNQA